MTMHQLSASQGLYRSLFDHAGTAMVILEEDLTVSMLNKEAENLMGSPEGEMAGKIPWNELIRLDGASACSLPALRNPVRMTPEYEARLTCRTGTLKHVLVKLSSLPDTNKTIACLIDISERKETEKALQKNEEKYRNILESIDEGYFEVDPAGNLTFCNDSLCRIIGYPREELLGMNNRQYTTPETAEKMYRIFNHVYRTGHSAKVTDYEIIRKDGSSCFLAISASLLRDSEGKPAGFRGMVRDITERKQAEKALQESESRYRHLVKHAPAGIYEIDFLERKFVTVNDVMCEYTGYDRQEFLSLSPLAILSEESRGRFLERMSKVFAGEKVLEAVEYKILGKNGKDFWVILYTRYRYENGMPTGATVVVHDITERRLSEEALRKSEERYRRLVDNAGEGIFIYQDNVIKFPNPKALEILGYSAEELAGIRFTDLLHPDDVPVILGLHQQEGPKKEETSSLRVTNKAGEDLWLEVNAVPISWEGAPAFLHLFRDVTLQKKLEAQLAHAQKMEAIGTLAGGIAHNFNNLLMGIQGNISLMLLDTPSTDRHFERLAGIERLIESGSKLTGQLLGYARGGKYEAQSMDLNRLVKETSQTFGLTKKEIAVHLDLCRDLWHVSADRAQVEEVLMNLFVNAADAMPRGGDLFLITRNVTEKALQGKPFKVEPGDYARIEVRDTGSGMDGKTMARVFDPFFTTKPAGRGTGLGLASAYGIIKAHDGYIDVASEEGSGTCFSVYLPATMHPVDQETPVLSGPLRGAETLLLVDDEENVLKVAQLMLEKLGYFVLPAKNSKEAIELFAASKDSIHMAILDMIMPDMGGGMLYEKLKELNPGLKALLSSGYGLDGQAMEILRKGCNGFIQKPFGLADLSKKVRDIIDGIASQSIS